MNYELAKKLKDAGFPQKSRIGSILTKNDAPPQTEDDYAYPPTLSELIEACGDDFGFLQAANVPNIHKRIIGGWAAGAYGTDEPISVYETPEEAVANLWLALNT